MGNIYQDLSRYRNPPNFRGRPAWFVQLWWLVQATLFSASPQFLFGWRSFLLRLFGARIGRDCRIRPGTKVTYPWKLSMGDYCWVGDDTVLYSLGEISIGSHTVISQGCYLCTGSHDYESLGFPIYAKPITIGPEAWLAAQTFVAPGVTIGKGAIVGARSLVLGDIPPGSIAHGHPAKVTGSRAYGR